MPNGEARVQVVWEVHGIGRKLTQLHRGLFGRRVKKKSKFYYYDGLLGGWKNGRPIKIVGYERWGKANISVPASLENEIHRLLDDLKIDCRTIPYSTKDNLYLRRYSELGTASSLSSHPKKLGQAEMADFL